MIPKTFFSIALFFFVIGVVEDYVVEDYFLHDCCCCCYLFVFFSSKRLYLTHIEEHVPCKLCFGTQPLLPEDLKCD